MRPPGNRELRYRKSTPPRELSRSFNGSPSVNTAPTVDSLPMPAFARMTDSVVSSTPASGFSSWRIDSAPSSKRPTRPLTLPP